MTAETTIFKKVKFIADTEKHNIVLTKAFSFIIEANFIYQTTKRN